MKKLISLVVVIALLSVSIAIAGNAYGKVKNSEGARDCAGVNFDPHADELGVADDVIACLQAKGIAINSHVCSSSADGCCNVAYLGTDPDCEAYGEICNNDVDDDGDELIDEYCLPDDEACTYSWQCQSGACDPVSGCA